MGLCGDGGSPSAELLSYPFGLWLSSNNVLYKALRSFNNYVADTGNSRIRRVTNNIITTIMAQVVMELLQPKRLFAVAINIVNHSTIDEKQYDSDFLYNTESEGEL